MDYRNLNNNAFEFMMKNALIERYKDEVKDLRRDTDEEFNFADALKSELEKKNSDDGNNNGGGNIY